LPRAESLDAIQPGHGDVVSHPPAASSLRDVKLDHLQHRVHDPARSLGVGITHQLARPIRHYLPRHPEAVNEPAAPRRFTPVDQAISVVINLRLALAGDEKRNGRGEVVVRSTVEGLERSSVKLELNHQRRVITAVSQAPRIGEEGDIPVDSGGGIAVEPEAWRDRGHAPE
jgi:hypothetical protein